MDRAVLPSASMKWRHRWLGVAGLVAFASAAEAEPKVVERVAATVAGRPIFLSAVRERLRPFLLQLRAGTSDPQKLREAERRAAERVLARMVEARLFALAAKKRGISVSDAEIEKAVKLVASSQKLSIEKLYEEVAKSGFDRAAYHRELGLQILEQKVVAYEIARRFVGEPADQKERIERAERERKRLLQRLRKEHHVEVRWTP